MNEFDGQVEKALKRAENVSGWLTLLAIVMVVAAILAAVLGGFGLALTGVAGAALIYGVAVIINLLGMQLVISWGQIRKQDNGTAPQ
ncbi:hypothetical protein [Glycomyces tritici]|uniref:Uncharacterized protein n=1 Tax=Glycomyces tritici TaxID=2665176 RepID=A0ABT7YMK0_9ACTN|nr:hypothetical protein [Glycomyces tritici]MDN3239836.1 hypothetical protein [Glycomyces tritici]